MLGFDRGGACPQVFRHCREQHADWVTCRRAPLAVPAGLPVLTTITAGGRPRLVAWAEEMVHVKDYGPARQLTLFEHGQVALQILTSDITSCPAEILSWLKSRWREENFLKYASANYGIDKICDYIAGIQANTKIADNPARKKAVATVRKAGQALTAAREDLAAMLRDPAIPAAAKNTRLIPEENNPGRARPRRHRGRPGQDPRQAARQRHRPRRQGRAAADLPARPADDTAPAGAQRRALAVSPPQRLPAR
jgi:hypothetical protein